jgi:hypothetical protein
MILEVGTYVYGNVDVQPIAFDVCVLFYIEFLCRVMSHNHGILGELLVETFWGCAFDVEVKGLNGDKEATEWQERKKRTHFGQLV